MGTLDPIGPLNEKVLKSNLINADNAEMLDVTFPKLAYKCEHFNWVLIARGPSCSIKIHYAAVSK